MIGNPLTVADIISELRRGQIRIPEIQRNYVWKRSQVAKLLDSIYRGYPTGAILLWDSPDGIIARDLRTDLGKDVKADSPPKIVLDGQQRITSLGRVFDTQTPTSERILFNVIDEIFEPYSPRSAADSRWIDVTAFLSSELSELDLLDSLTESGTIPKGDKATRNRVHANIVSLGKVRDYLYPVEIVKNADLETVTEVFIRVNSGGTRLRDAELALARLAWKLPGSIVGPFEELEDECQTRGFDLDTRFLMRALISIATEQSRFKDLKAFWERPADQIERSWKKTASALKHALDFVEGNVGIPGSALLSSQVSLIPVAFVFANQRKLTSQEEKVLRRAFLLSNVFSRYSGPLETILNQDLSTLSKSGKGVEGLLEEIEKGLRGQTKIRAEDLERAGAASSYFPLAYLAAIGNKAVDWFTGIQLRRKSFAEDQNIEYHHIFPKKHLNAAGVDRYLRDEIANLAFLAQRANRSILARTPDDYLREIWEIAPERLEQQHVPVDRRLWNLSRFDDFLKARRKSLATAMNKVLDG